jgi:sigma-B regulation protein RsbU (phosphoserine phosphatase)
MVTEETALLHKVRDENLLSPDAARGQSSEQDTIRQLSQKVRALQRLLTTYKQLARRYQLMVRAIDKAARIQKSLLPRSFPEVQGYHFSNVYRPCETVGGDFYDFAQRNGDAAIIVCDVVGHGFQAALTTMLLKGVFQETAAKTLEPTELLMEMNGRLHKVFPDGMFTAAAVIHLNTSWPEVQFSNAGLPYPYVLRAADRSTEEVELNGTPLGMFGDHEISPYESRRLTLQPEDVLLVRSDGLGSISDREGKQFEDQALIESLDALAGQEGGQLIRELMDRALEFGNREPIPDDVCLLAVTRHN